jgi:hypothetical protein
MLWYKFYNDIKWFIFYIVSFNSLNKLITIWIPFQINFSYLFWLFIKINRYRDLRENNTSIEPVYWNFPSTITSFKFNDETTFNFDVTSFLNYDYLKIKPNHIAYNIEDIYGDRLHVFKRKLNLDGIVISFFKTLNNN